MNQQLMPHKRSGGTGLRLGTPSDHDPPSLSPPPMRFRRTQLFFDSAAACGRGRVRDVIDILPSWHLSPATSLGWLRLVALPLSRRCFAFGPSVRLHFPRAAVSAVVSDVSTSTPPLINTALGSLCQPCRLCRPTRTMARTMLRSAAHSYELLYWVRQS